MTTNRQKAALDYCYYWGFPKYNGDRENFTQVSNYLSKYLSKAKALEQHYESERKWEDFMMNCGNIGIENTY